MNPRLECIHLCGIGYNSTGATMPIWIKIRNALHNNLFYSCNTIIYENLINKRYTRIP